MEVKILALKNEGIDLEEISELEYEYVTGYIDKTKINGYYYTRQNANDGSVNLLFDNQTLTVLVNYALLT